MSSDQLKQRIKTGLIQVQYDIINLNGEYNSSNIEAFEEKYKDLFLRIVQTDFGNSELNQLAKKFPKFNLDYGITVRWRGNQRFIKVSHLRIILIFCILLFPIGIPIWYIIKYKSVTTDLNEISALSVKFIQKFDALEQNEGCS